MPRSQLLRRRPWPLLLSLSLDAHGRTVPKPIAGNWPGLPPEFQSGIDAAFWMSNDAVYMFKGDQYVRFTTVGGGVDPGYPKPIAGNWPGLPPEFQSGIDAVLMRKDTNQIYFFKDDQFIRYSDVSAGVDAGYPKPIEGNWKGVPSKYNDGIDAALWRDSNGKIYLFKNSRFYGTYVRISRSRTASTPATRTGCRSG